MWNISYNIIREKNKCGWIKLLDIILVSFLQNGSKNNKSRISYYTVSHPFKLLIPARMISSTRSKLLAMTEHELIICFLTM